METFVYDILEILQKTFGVVCWAYKDGNIMIVCISDNAYYRSAKFRKIADLFHQKIKKNKWLITFCYCSYTEKYLENLLAKNNLWYVP